MTIDHLSFGRIRVDGRLFQRDLILIPPQIHVPWVRHRGHELLIEDLQPVLNHPPEILIIGTGVFGRMRTHEAVVTALADRGIECRVLRSREAVDAFNRAVEKGRHCAGAFHLTC